ncbi:hypothetical protein D3C78_657800 [compost metagenome]
MHEEEGQDHADHGHVEGAGDVHGHEGRGQARGHGEHAAELDDAQAYTDQGHGEDADQDAAEDAAVFQHRDHQEADGGQQRTGGRQVTDVHQGCRMGDHDAGGLQADQPEEQADPRAHGEAQAAGDAVEQPFADAREGQDHEQHAGEEHRAERDLPAVTHGVDHGVGEEGVQAHARSETDRPVGVEAHEQATEGCGQAGGDKGRAMIDPGIGHDVRVDENDVGHGDEGRQAGSQFGLHGGAVETELEEPFEQTVGGRCCGVRSLFLLFDAFHSVVLLISFVLVTQSLELAPD